jgi:hypothetical protein
MKTTLKKRWICFAGEYPAEWSLATSRKGAIEIFMQYSSLSWSDRKKYQWSVHKVNIEIQLLN